MGEQEIGQREFLVQDSDGYLLRFAQVLGRRTRASLPSASCLAAHPDLDSANRMKLETLLLASPILGPIIGEWSAISLPDCWLVAGAIAQTVWNSAFGFTPDHGLKDVDLVYFDAADLSEAGEAHHAERVRCLFAGLSAKVDVKNEARVHLWYEAKFGYSISPYTSATHAITTFPTTATTIGVQPGPSRLSITAPYGLSDLFGPVVRPNKVQITRAIYEAKVARWRCLWPGLTIIDW
jgi:hypothetical protein